MGKQMGGRLKLYFAQSTEMGGKQKRQPTHPWNQNLYYAHCHSTFVSVSICVPWHLT